MAEAPPVPAHWSRDVVLGDGGTAHVRPIRPSDAELLAAFHARLSPESIYLRFFSPHPRLSPRELAYFSTVDHDARVALVLLLGDALIGVGRYDRLPRSDAAEVAFIVDDAQHGRGIATLLLERLAAAARERGIHRFFADVLPHNRAMLHVFHDAGFSVTSRFQDGVVRLSFPIDRTPTACAQVEERERLAQARSVARLLAPRAIGVITEGDPADGVVASLLRNLEESGFDGPVLRLPASPPATVPQGVDLAFVAVPPEQLPAQIERCAAWGVHAAVLVAQGRPEDEARTARGDRALAARARRDGLRLVGPASLGLARPSGAAPWTAVAHGGRLPPGALALFVENPEAARNALGAVRQRGIGLSTFIAAGRKADLSASDALEYWDEDDATRVIALVLRSLGNPLRSLAVARRVARRKPVLVWRRDAAEAIPEPFAKTLVEHAGVISCRSLDDLLDLAGALLDGPRGATARHHADTRITAWEAWRSAPVEVFQRPSGIDPYAARCLVDARLAAHPAGLALGDEDAVSLLACFGVAAEIPDGAREAEARLHVMQDAGWGSQLAASAPGHERVARLVPLGEADVRALAAVAGSPSDLVRRVAALAVELPELASLALSLPAVRGAATTVVPGSARLAPWTLGDARDEPG